MNPSCCGVILAGGLSSRFAGKNKALFELRGRRIIEPIIDVFRSVFREIMIVTNAPLKYLPWDVTLATDIYAQRSSLTGIHTGLFYANTPWVFVTACDTPFISKQMVELVLSEIKPGVAAVMPETPGGIEPLFAAYSTDTLPVIERHVREGKFKIQRVFGRMRVVKIPAAKVAAADPEQLCFFNINTTEDFERARALLEATDAPEPSDG